jgi:predicted NBD/HSP70 family sugar kinase
MTNADSVRALNRSRVIDALRRHGTVSRAGIARETGLSRSTVSSLVADLQRQGFIVELPEDGDGDAPGRVRSSGRPPVLLALDPSAGAVLGVDFGHRHLRVALADLSSRVLAERRVELDVDRAATSALDGAADLAATVVEEAGLDRALLVGAGMGLPGPIDRVTGAVGHSVILPGWGGLRAAEELSRRLGLAVRVDNDANLGALAEVSYGAGRGATDVVYIKMSSGIGAGIILGGRLHRGATGIAGEMGHVLVDPRGRVCRCGNRGCLETLAAGPALLHPLAATHGDDLTVAGMIDLALAAISAAGGSSATRAAPSAGRSPTSATTSTRRDRRRRRAEPRRRGAARGHPRVDRPLRAPGRRRGRRRPCRGAGRARRGPRRAGAGDPARRPRPSHVRAAPGRGRRMTVAPLSHTKEDPPP